MVDPKKDYELLMRYLQGGGLKREPAAIPEQPYTEDWQPAPATATPSIYSDGTAAPARTKHKKRKLAFPKLMPASAFKNARIATAAVAVVALLIILWKGYSFYNLSPESIYNKMYIPFVATAANNRQQAEKNSIEHYYAAANPVAVTLQSKKQAQLTDKEKLLTGLAFLQRDDYSAAIKWLEPASNNFKNPYRQTAEFYLALTYLKNEDYDHCIAELEHIAHTPSHPYHNQVSPGLIQDIKMLKWK